MQRLRQLRELQDQLNSIEAARLSQIDVFAALGYEPTPRQQEFHDAQEFDVLFGGAAGGGKTKSLVMHAIRECVRYPGIRVGAFRRTYGELKESLLAELALCGYAKALDANWKGSDYELRFPNGSLIMFRYAETMADATRRLGGQYQLLLFDERTLTSPDVISFLESRMRSGREDIPVLGIRSATNPGGPGHCLSLGDVLTPGGWKGISTFKPGDPVYTVTADGELVETVVSHVHRHEYDGELVDVTARGLRMTCTPGHRVAKRGGIAARRPQSVYPLFSLVPFEELPGQATILRSVRWTGKPLGWFTPEECPTRKRKLVQPRSLPGRTFAALLGWFLSEGWTSEVGGRSFGIAQMKPASRERLRALLEDECGFKASWSRTGARIYAPDWWNYFRQFGKCREKFIPAWVKAGSEDDLRAMFTALMDGDGHWETEPDGGCYYTISRQLADDVAEVAIKLGYIVHASSRERDDRDGLTYAVNFKRTRSGGTELLTGNHVYKVSTSMRRRSDVQRVPYRGPVYCLTIDDTETFVVRQHGSVWVSGNSAVKDRYIKPTNYGEKVIVDQRGREVRFIPSRLSDNPHVNPEYASDLLALPEKLRAAYLDGDWDVFAGQMFPEWSRERHIVVPRELPASWRRYAGIDWGYTAPWAVVWAAVDEDGRVWVYREAYAKEVGEADQAKRILAAEEGEYVTARFADDAMWATRGDALPIAQVYADHGCALTAAGKGPGSRVTGWQRIHSYLAEAPACPEHRERGWETCPRLHAFSTLERFATGISDLPHSPTGNPEDADTRADDHIADATRYLLVNIGNEPRWHFPSFGPAQQTGPRTIDPQAVDPNPQRPKELPKSFGGFPVLSETGNPWEAGNPWAG